MWIYGLIDLQGTFMTADASATEQAQQAAGLTVAEAVSSVDAKAIEIKGLSVGDTFSAPASLTIESKAVGADISGSGSALADLRAFG